MSKVKFSMFYQNLCREVQFKIQCFQLSHDFQSSLDVGIGASWSDVIPPCNTNVMIPQSVAEIHQCHHHPPYQVALECPLHLWDYHQI